MRKASIKRKTKETDVEVEVDLDGTGVGAIATGIGFFDHMLDLLARHSRIDITVKAKGDLHIDHHHTTEDVGIALGQAVKQALGDMKGITRYASVHMPMDEALTRVAIDISGRPFLVFKAEFVRDGFHFWAFLLAPFWMLRQRLWFELIAYALILGGATFALRRLGIEESAGGLVWFLISVLVGIEASSLLRWKLSRRGYDNLGVVVGDDLEDAERRFFDGWVSNTGRLATPPAAPAAPPAPSPFDRP